MVITGFTLQGCSNPTDESVSAPLHFSPTGPHKSPSWSELHPSPDGDKTVTWMQANLGVGDTVPIIEGGKKLFQLKLADGSDDRLTLELIAGPDSQRFDLRREGSIGINLPIGSFTVTFPTVHVSAKPGEQPSSPQVMLLVHHQKG